MSRYILIRRLTWPAILLLLGTVALLHEANLVSWKIFLPLLLILIGVIKLTERAAIANELNPMTAPFPGGAGPYYQGQPVPAPQVPAQTAIVPSPHDVGDDLNGGKL